MRDRFPEDKIAILSLFPGGDLGTLRRVVRERWKAGRIPVMMDEDADLFAQAGVRGVPMSILYDKDGEYVVHWEGYPGEDAIVSALSKVAEKTTRE